MAQGREGRLRYGLALHGYIVPCESNESLFFPTQVFFDYCNLLSVFDYCFTFGMFFSFSRRTSLLRSRGEHPFCESVRNYKHSSFLLDYESMRTSIFYCALPFPHATPQRRLAY